MQYKWLICYIIIFINIIMEDHQLQVITGSMHYSPD